VLGLEVPEHMDGRVIDEALVDGDEGAIPFPEVHVASRVLEGGEYTQRLVVAPARSGGGYLVGAGAEFIEG
jgi:hypothetical protein